MVSSASVAPQSAATVQERPHPELTPESYIELRRPAEVSVAPSGRAVALAVRAADLASNRFFTVLYLWSEAGGVERSSPRFADLGDLRWSPDGSRIGFLASEPLDALEIPGGPFAYIHAGQPQLWSLDPQEDPIGPRRLTYFAGGVLDYAWMADTTILVLARDSADGAPALWRVDREGATERVWSGDPGIREIDLSPDGKSVVYSTNRGGADADLPNYDLGLLDLEAGRSRSLTDRSGGAVTPLWVEDGSAVVFRAPTDPRLPIGASSLFRVGLDGRIENLTDAFDRSVLDHRPVGDRIVFAAAIGTRTHLFVLRPDGSVRNLAGGETSYGAFDAADPGVTFAVRQSGNEPPDLWRLGGGGPERVTDLNPRARAWPLARQQPVSWRAPDGLNVEGLLIYPAGFEEGMRYPLLVHPAGGPGGRVVDVLAQTAAYQLFAAAGYAVLAPNFRGSVGYGRDFAAQPRRGLAGGHLPDIIAGIAAVADLGVADTSRVGIYESGDAAGYAEWALTRSPLFDAGVVQFGIDGLLWRDDSALARESAGRALRREAREDRLRIRAPLLIVATDGGDRMGEEAREARSLHATLEGPQRKVELVELEPGVRSPRGRVDLFLRLLRWMDRHLKPGDADLPSFYMVDEPVPGPEGWTLRVDRVEIAEPYAAVQPDSGRFVEIALDFKPERSGSRDSRVRGFRLDPADGVTLLGPDGESRPLVGTVTELFGERTLVLGMPAAFSVPASQRGGATALTLHLAFQVPNEAGAYRLLVTGFRPVRIWLPGMPGTGESP